MKHSVRTFVALACLSLLMTPAVAQDSAAASGPLRVLLVAGGCCHDYAAQSKLLKEGIEHRINATVTLEYSESTETTTTFDIYESDDWANDFDVIIHDECSAKVTDQPYVNRILDAHKAGVPAVNLHCAMHSYRWGDYKAPVEIGADNAGWYEMLGIQSSAHGPKAPIEVKYVGTDHPITKGFKDWTTIDEELYNNVRVYSGATALASGDQVQKPNAKMLKKDPDAKATNANAVVMWTNEYGPNKTKIFSTTLGHYNDTVADDRYMDLVVRGLLWTTGNLSPDGSPAAAYAR